MEVKQGEEITVKNGLKFMVGKDMEFKEKLDVSELLKMQNETMQTAYQHCLESENEGEFLTVSIASLAVCDGKDRGYTSMMLGITGCIVQAWIATSEQGYTSFEARRNAACVKLAKYLRTMRDGYAELVDAINAKIEADGR